MLNEFGICCRCGGEIGPPFDRQTDWLCKQCYDDTHKVRRHPAVRWGNERLITPYERERSLEWQKEVDERIDREMKESQIGNSAKSSAE